MRAVRRFVHLGTLMAALVFSRTADAADVTWSAPLEVARGAGVRGDWQQNESHYDHVDDGSPAIDGSGNIAIAWVDQKRKDVFFQRYSPDGTPLLPVATNVSNTPKVFSWLPRIVTSPREPREIFILWQEIIFSGGSHGGEIMFARSSDGGASFSTPLNLSRSVGGDGKGRINRQHWQNGSFDLALPVDGTLLAAWTEFDGPLWFSRSTDAGSSFSPPQRIAGAERDPARGPTLASGSGGAVYLAWTVGEDASADIRVVRSLDGGKTFDRPQIAEKTRSYSDAPKLAVDSRGTVHLVFAESSGGPFDSFHVRYSRSLDQGQSFSKSKRVRERGRQEIESASFPGIAIDERDVLYLTCEVYPSRRERPRGIGFARSTDLGQTFTQFTVVPSSADAAGGSNGSHQGLLMRKLAVNANGALALVNSSLKPGSHSRVWLIRGEPEAGLFTPSSVETTRP